MGIVARKTNSKSAHPRIYVVTAMPTPANANPISTAMGTDATIHGESARPIATITTAKVVA